MPAAQMWTPPAIAGAGGDAHGGQQDPVRGCGQALSDPVIAAVGGWGARAQAPPHPGAKRSPGVHGACARPQRGVTPPVPVRTLLELPGDRIRRGRPAHMMDSETHGPGGGGCLARGPVCASGPRYATRPLPTGRPCGCSSAGRSCGWAPHDAVPPNGPLAFTHPIRGSRLPAVHAQHSPLTRASNPEQARPTRSTPPGTCATPNMPRARGIGLFPALRA